MSVSVIIPTLNEEKHISHILHDLSIQTVSPGEVIVIDGGSDDDTTNIVVKIPGITLVTADKPVGNQRQVGGEKAKGELLIFLDADTRIERNFIQEVDEYFTNHTVDIGCPHYLPRPSTGGFTVFYTVFNSLFFLLQYIKPSGAGSCIVVKKRVFDLAGGFDKSFVFDDIEFIYRASKQGRFRILPFCVFVSPRRVQKFGYIRSIVTYLQLSFYFATNQYEKANSVSYPFGKY